MYTGHCTREEFGVNMYDTIVTVSGILAIQEHIAVAIHHEEGHKLQVMKARRDALRATLARQLPLLTDREMIQL